MTAYSSNLNAERLLQLSEEVGRIANTLARLSIEPARPQQAQQPLENGELATISAETVRAVIRARRLRERFFNAELFADPAWDILLDLLLAELAHQRVSVSSACMAAAVPPTTALRWLKSLAEQGHIIRRADPHDARRVFVELSPESSLALRRFFTEVGSGMPV